VLRCKVSWDAKCSREQNDLGSKVFISLLALQISKNHFATFDFSVKTKLVSTVVHINSTIITWLGGRGYL
jgi:hypothetical protein